jgi:histidyl-tRNA synthetase
MSRIQAPKGTFDILPLALASEPWQSSEIWEKVETLLNQSCAQWGFSQIRLPLFEATELFHKSTGEATDIVQKEMYTFEDKGKRSMTLRPEGTPGSLRALLEASAFNKSKLQKVYYMGPMFRYERPQKGRYRQFHQFGVELLGPRTSWFDAEIISLAYHIPQILGLKRAKLLINTLASDSCRAKYRDQLKAYFSKVQDKLSEDSQRRLQSNPLRILDSKDPLDEPWKLEAPKLSACMNEDSKRFFDEVLSLISKAGIEFEISERLVRGLDYYCDTVFEVQIDTLGAQSAIGGGGRYGRMLSDMGGPALEGVGFAMGMERLIQATLAAEQIQVSPPRPDIFLIAMGSDAAAKLFELACQLRSQGMRVETWHQFEPKKLKNGLALADTLKARFVGVLGDDEIANGQIQLKEMDSRNQQLIAWSQLYQHLQSQ